MTEDGKIRGRRRVPAWVLAGTILGLFCGALVFAEWDRRDTIDRATQDRLAALEERVNEARRPVIHIEKATVYNVDGEVVVDTAGDKDGSD